MRWDRGKPKTRRTTTEDFRCRACGYFPLDGPILSENNGSTDVICTACRFHYGYDNFQAADEEVAYVRYRFEWIRRGMPWGSSSVVTPTDWDPETLVKEATLKQLDRVLGRQSD